MHIKRRSDKTSTATHLQLKPREISLVHFFIAQLLCANFARQFDNWSECSGRTSFHKISRDLGLRCTVNAYHILPAGFCSDSTVVQRQSLNISCTCIVSHFEKKWRLVCEDRIYPDSKVHGTNMGPTWGWQDPGGPHVSPMNRAIWVLLKSAGNQQVHW